MKTKLIILSMLTLTFFTLSVVSVKGQNNKMTNNAKQDTVIYTCTMHPEIQLGQAGVCPKCGMALVKQSVSSGKQHKNHKMKMMSMMMGGMNEIENMEKNNSAEKNKVTNDSIPKEAILYTCSMHPEIQSNQPGNCPKCGMALIAKSTISGKKEKHRKMAPIRMGMGIGMGIMMVGMLFFVMRH